MEMEATTALVSGGRRWTVALMRIAAGDGNMADPMSPYCAHYPGSGHAKILDAESKMFVDMVGKGIAGTLRHRGVPDGQRDGEALVERVER